MKKSILIFFIPFLCFSQNFNAGIIGGISTTQVSGDGLKGFNKIGPKVGLYVNREFSWFSIQLELQYLSKGSKKIINNANQNNLNTYANYKFHLDYVGVPIVCFTNITEKIKFELGTAINILINQNEEIDFYVDNSREVSRIENAILIGLIYVLNEKYSISVRGSNSIFPIRKHSIQQSYQWNSGQYNTGLSFNLLYEF